MPADADDSTDHTAKGGVLVPPAEVVRSSADRERRLTEYIRAHTGADICVRLTPHVPTACVIPTSKEALIESDNADFSDEQVRQLVATVDADYLVLISTYPANVDSLPITDQLTADRAQQFGYALHELGHIRYTAIADAAALLEDRIGEEYREFIHGLWNACEDAAIENQLALDQSQLAADRLELVNRSVSTHAEDLPADSSAQFTFRDALEAALYDTGIYDTEVHDVLCDPDDDRATFASDADRQAFEQIEASINEIVATVLSTPDSLERANRVFAWWETEIKPLLDPSCRDEENSDQPTSNSTSDESTADAETDSFSQPPPETTGPNESDSENGDEQQREDAANDANPSGRSNNSKGDESDGIDTQDETRETDEPAEHSETVTPESEGEPEPDERPDPDKINTDQRQSTPGSDALEYPDLGDTEDAAALSDPSSETCTDEEGDGASEPEERSHSQSSADTSDSTQPGESSGMEDEKPDGPENATTDEDDGVPGRTESSDVAEDHENADTSSDFDANSDFENEIQSDTAVGEPDASPQNETVETDNEEVDQKTGHDANDERATDTGGENSEQSDESTSDAGQTENLWKTGDSTNQTSLGSFSDSSGQVENGAGGSDAGGTGERSNESSDSKEDDSVTGSENGSGPESELESGDSSPDNGPGDGTVPESDSTKGDSTGSESDSHAESTEEETIESATENESADQDEDVSATKGKNEGERGQLERPERCEGINEQKLEPTPIHADGDGGLEREGALDTDRDAAHDEADRKTPDENALKRDLDDVADALEALDDQNGGSGAAPGSISEFAIMPDSVGSNSLDVDERWREATVDSEFVADALRKALRESRRDAHRSGVTSGTFDRQRADALARGDVVAFQVPQFGEDKQYDLVILLDRSGSMRRFIGTAQDALVRFALACEDIGINVCVIDLYSDEARLVKPFSVDCEHVRGSVFSQATGGSTPLADALGLGRELLEQRRNSPLVLVVTDGKPGSPDAYEEELTQSFAPVCGLTLVLDHPSGSVPDRVARNERFYDRHVYVHDPDQLTDRLDQFALMFNGL